MGSVTGPFTEISAAFAEISAGRMKISANRDEYFGNAWPEIWDSMADKHAH